MKSSSRLDSAVFQLTPSRTRFVRFVSNPEVLERVYALESEILQIEEAIAIQSNNEIGLAMVKDHQTKSVEHIDGTVEEDIFHTVFSFMNFMLTLIYLEWLYILCLLFTLSYCQLIFLLFLPSLSSGRRICVIWFYTYSFRFSIMCYSCISKVF
ncbi:uncharacterized protein LOC131179521 [Hevea brasiliensis]|uniref:uncharacterized protein LOC110642157 n=1 Tax=Hevea brasiliensis TaxID=3981 RepID=UPI0025CCE941|nr:uncharacterized protein LOC110642157 [Hevea brasiliensis]XP_058002382.1 uncharacterized protein LOC131179521 [Hevea brasiliensis]